MVSWRIRTSFRGASPRGRVRSWLMCSLGKVSEVDWMLGGCVEIIGQIVEGQSIHQSGLTHNTEKNTPHQCLMTTSTGRKKVNYTSTVLVLISTKTQQNCIWLMLNGCFIQYLLSEFKMNSVRMLPKNISIYRRNLICVCSLRKDSHFQNRSFLLQFYSF